VRLEGERKGWKHSLSMNTKIEKIHAILHTMYQKEKVGFSAMDILSTNKTRQYSTIIELKNHRSDHHLQDD